MEAGVITMARVVAAGTTALLLGIAIRSTLQPVLELARFVRAGYSPGVSVSTATHASFHSTTRPSRC